MPLIDNPLKEMLDPTFQPPAIWIETELVRERLATQISEELASDGKTGVLVLSPDIEQTISASIQRTEHGTLITLDPSTIAKIVDAVREAVEGVSVHHSDPIILCSPENRPHLRRMLERFLPRCPIITANALMPEVQVESLGILGFAE